MNSLKAVILAALICVVLGCAAAPSGAQTRLVGTTQVLDMIDAAKGKVVLINFFASYCPPCKKEIPGLMQLRSEYSEDQVLIVGISMDHDLAQMEAFIKKTGFSYPVFLGNAELAHAYQVSAIPHNVLYDPMGRRVENRGGYLSESQMRRLLEKYLPQ